MVGAALQRDPVPLPLCLLAVPRPGKIEPSAGHVWHFISKQKRINIRNL